MVPSAPTGELMAQTEGKRQRGRLGQGERERERRKPGGWRETQTDRKTEWLIRICLFSLVRQGLRGSPSGIGGRTGVGLGPLGSSFFPYLH